MKTIWKYPLEVTDVQEITMPVESEILSVHFQHGQLTLWTQVKLEDLAATTELRTRTIYIFGTGNPWPTDTPKLFFIGTALDPNMPLVWHIYEEYSNGR